MELREAELKDVFIINLKPFNDNRGWFARSFCKNVFSELNIDFDIAQSNLSFSEKKHTLRGLHYQKGRYEESKLVSCLRGSILDVIIDMREESATFGKHMKYVLNLDNKSILLIPKGFAHGFITLEDNTLVNYLSSNYYSPEFEQVIRWNDPYFNIEWPTNTPILSEKDRNFPDYKTKVIK